MTDADAPRRARLPDVALSQVGGAGASELPGTVPLRERRRGTALVLVGGQVDAPVTAYLRELAAAEPALREWDGRVLVIVPGAGGDVAALALRAMRLPFPVLADPDGAVAAAAGVATPAIVVIDQWGEVRETREVAATQPWLPPAEVEQWMRFLSIQCAG
jgi:hypothetical protein